MISPNLAGLLVFAAGATLAVKWKSRLEPGPELTALRTRRVGWALLAAVVAATVVSVFQLRDEVAGPSVTMAVPVGPVKPAGREFVPHRITALLVREHDGRVMRAWETVQRTERESLVVDSEYLKSGKKVSVKMCPHGFGAGEMNWSLGVRDEKWHDPHHFSWVPEHKGAFGRMTIYSPTASYVLSDEARRTGNLFSLIMPGAYYHLVVFAAPEVPGAGFERRDASAVMASLDWKHPAGYVRPNVMVGGSADDLAQWKAVRGEDMLRANRHRYRSGYALMPNWIGGFGWVAGLAFLLVPFLLTAGKPYRAARGLLGCVAMLLLAVAAERVVAARWLPAPMYSHFFTRSEG